MGWGGGGGAEGKAEVVWNKGKTKGGRGRWGLAAVGGGGGCEKVVLVWRAVSPDFWRDTLTSMNISSFKEDQEYLDVSRCYAI